MEDLYFQIEVEDIVQCANCDKKYLLCSDNGKGVYLSDRILKAVY